MCCKRWSILYQGESCENTWMRAALMWRASWNKVSSPQWGFNLPNSLAIRLCCLAPHIAHCHQDHNLNYHLIMIMIKMITWSSWCESGKEQFARSLSDPRSGSRTHPVKQATSSSSSSSPCFKLKRVKTDLARSDASRIWVFQRERKEILPSKSKQLNQTSWKWEIRWTGCCSLELEEKMREVLRFPRDEKVKSKIQKLVNF